MEPSFEEKLGLNPLITNLRIEVAKRTDYSKLTYVDDAFLPVELEMERGKIVKVYASAKNREVVACLNAAAQRLMFWVAFELKPGKDYIQLNKDRFMKENAITSVNTYKSAFATLVRSNILALTVEKNVFWINPEYFFCGSRINKYPDRVVEYKKAG